MRLTSFLSLSPARGVTLCGITLAWNDLLLWFSGGTAFAASAILALAAFNG